MEKNLFKALVIDDEEIRNKTYENVLSDKFIVEIINDVNSITKKKIMQYDLLVIDICLSKNVESLTAFKILREFEIGLPTVLVSGEWIKENGEPNEFILQVPNYKNVIKVVSWNEFNKDENNLRIAEEIYFEFCKVRNIEMGNGSNKCIILHLSDSQFGGDASGAACNDNMRIANYLKGSDISPDIIIISGDIADKGQKNEFLMAKEWIEQLATELWNIDGDLKYSDRQRIVIVPGNHDFDISICAADLYYFLFCAEKKDMFIEKDNPDFTLHQKQGFYNFIEFASSLTGDEAWYHYMKKMIHINERFLNYGLNILNFNSVFGINSRNCENRFDEFYCDLTKRKEAELKCKMTDVDGIINILVMHNPPEDFHTTTTNGQKSWNIMQSLIQGNKINICLFGHTHDTKYPYRLRDNGGNYCKDLLCIPAPSVRLAAASRTEDASRGFNIIEIKKNDDNHREVIIQNYEMKKAEIERVNQDSYDIPKVVK